jgi:hypothetical protein
MISTKLYSKIQCAYDEHCEEYNSPPKEIVFSEENAKLYFGDKIPEKLYGMTVTVDSINYSGRDQEELFYIKGSTTF